MSAAYPRIFISAAILGEAINSLLIVKILMAHEDIESTDRYLRAIAIDTHVLADVLDTLLAEQHGR